MNPQNLSDFSNQQLSQKLKQLENSKVIDAAIVGLTVGIAVYGAVKSGFGFFTLFPLLLAYIIVRNSKNNKILARAIQKELEDRG
ncbi:hypothetical protein BCY91_03750 [Pelobium manganitolerans]|uniref:FUSC family protein n=1 Tax=Pelobium manganitolerans TaxID=1842495 RepID=A0A419S7N2_9SPHI|nr:hypothetical protein [Pelobium manganitolerans]RKD17259.1 hypothetical protein BCY91_03750 [Pelobium manganitolerans]